MPRFQRAVPVLQVRDVERSMGWYVDAFGFEPDPFPEKPPYGFAILRRDDCEIMLQCAGAKETIQGGDGWAVYLRTSGEDLLDLATAIGRVAPVVRGPERMFYGLVEFEVVDPDGYRVCVSGPLPAIVNVPHAREPEEAAR
jgi:uncharacterized glyoxalase superfamily protein PhnB